MSGRGAGDGGGRGVDRTDVAWARGEAKTRAMVTNDPRSPVRCERTGPDRDDLGQGVPAVMAPGAGTGTGVPAGVGHVLIHGRHRRSR